MNAPRVHHKHDSAASESHDARAGDGNAVPADPPAGTTLQGTIMKAATPRAKMEPSSASSGISVRAIHASSRWASLRIENAFSGPSSARPRICQAPANSCCSTAVGTTVDQVAGKYWNAYGAARDAMLERTDHRGAPWILVAADDKQSARLNLIRDLLQRVECPQRADHWAQPDRRVVFEHAAHRRPRLTCRS